MTVLEYPDLSQLHVLVVEVPLRAPLTGELVEHVGVLLGRGERHIVLDLSHVLTIDAAGIGELVRGYNEAIEADGALQIVHVNTWVREVLQLVGLFDTLSAKELTT